MTDIATAPAAGVLRFVAAGSVDDGKSTLIGRLLYDTKAILEDQIEALRRVSRKKGSRRMDLALLTDGLIDEREQGITIDVAYRYFSTPKRKFIIADVPGHEQYTRNMATGASTANLGIIVVDARNGVTAQSCRHLYLLTLFGVHAVIIAVNKMDLVEFSQERFEAIRADFTRFADEFRLEERPAFLPISALEGDNVVSRSGRMPWYKGLPLLDLLESAPAGADAAAADFRFPVQLVCRPQSGDFADFRGYMGRIESGRVRPGDEVAVYPSGHRSRVREIYAFEGDLFEAEAPQSVTLTLEDEIDISRGDIIAHPASAPRTASQLDVLVCWMSDAPVDLRKKYLIKHRSKTLRAKVAALRYKIDVGSFRPEASDTLAINDIGLLTLKFQDPIPYDDYAENRATGAFILIDEDTNDTVAGGVIRSGA